MMIAPPSLIALFLFWGAIPLFSSSISDLGSPSQNARDEAAKALQKDFVPPPRSRWEPIVAQMKPGDPKATVLERLSPFHVIATDGIGSGGSHYMSYRLDDAWVLECCYRTPADTLINCTLTESLRYVWVNPPPDFSGVWITYYVNGQRSHRIDYSKGHYSGEFIHYHSNGQKAYVQHYVDHVATGADCGWYADGKRMYEGQYRNDKQDGRWVHWYPNGRLQSELNYKAGKNDGRDAGWFQNGQMRFEMNFKNGVKHGLEAGWDEQGVLQYKREYRDGEIVQ